MYKKILEKKSIFTLLKITWSHLDKFRHNQLKLLAFMIFLNSFAEVISIASLIPYLYIIINPESLVENKSFSLLIDFFAIKDLNALILPFTIIFLFAVIISGFIKLIFTFYSWRISFAIGSDLSIKAYKNTINKPYSYHLNTNSNVLLTTINKDINEIVSLIINPSFQFISSIFISLSIFITIFFLNFNIAITSTILILLTYLIFVKATKNIIKKISERNVFLSQKLTKILQESIGAIKDIILSKNQNYYTNEYSLIDRNFRREISIGNFINYVPRLIIEPFGIIFIIFFGYYLVIIEKNNDAFPILGAITFSAVRLLPLAQRIYEGINSPRLAKSRLINLLSILKVPPQSNIRKYKKNHQFLLKNSIKLRDISFIYGNDSKQVLEKLNLTINVGERVGIIGKTGSGKSTLIDMIMGLIQPSNGSIYIDDKDILKKSSTKYLESWQESFVHVPQNIFLADTSIGENIALGVKKIDIDFDRLNYCARKAELYDFILDLDSGFDTFVGERGVRLSGGQRQRIGIARALYKGKKTIFLDEATSALDNNTEKLIMKNFSELDKNITLIIITHRLNTLNYCDKIYELKNKILIERKDF